MFLTAEQLGQSHSKYRSLFPTGPWDDGTISEPQSHLVGVDSLRGMRGMLGILSDISLIKRVCVACVCV